MILRIPNFLQPAADGYRNSVDKPQVKRHLARRDAVAAVVTNLLRDDVAGSCSCIQAITFSPSRSSSDSQCMDFTLNLALPGISWRLGITARANPRRTPFHPLGEDSQGPADSCLGHTRPVFVDAGLDFGDTAFVPVRFEQMTKTALQTQVILHRLAMSRNFTVTDFAVDIFL